MNQPIPHNNQENPKQRIFVAMSGGVDSSTVAAILKEQGHDIIGVFMRQYDADYGPAALSDDLDAVRCSWREDKRDALAACATLGIPFEEWDFRDVYQREVVDYMTREYAAGRTPNPDVMCNRFVKFDAFFKKAREHGADMIATGHYVRIQHTEDGHGLYEAHDTNKDQSYFLWALSPEVLPYCLFPLGDLEKPTVRTLAKKHALANWDKKDSQGVCFIGKISMRDFLKGKIATTPGPLCTLDGKQVGTHDGAALYTIGQRHGLGFGGGEHTYYVAKKDMKANIVYVAPETEPEHLLAKTLQFDTVNWLAPLPVFPLQCKARTRYREPLHDVTIREVAPGTFMAEFEESIRAITEGQAIVLYDKGKMLGGGVITSK